MGTSRQWLGTRNRISARLLKDVALLLEETPDFPPDHFDVPDVDGPTREELEDLISQSTLPDDPLLHVHRDAVNAQLAKPQTARTYMNIRRALWSWPEFATLCRRARTILDVVVELARDEAFPWYLPVCAEDVRKLSRQSLRSYIRSVHELDCLAITRPGRVVDLYGDDPMSHLGLGDFPGRIDERAHDLTGVVDAKGDRRNAVGRISCAGHASPQ